MEGGEQFKFKKCCSIGRKIDWKEYKIKATIKDFAKKVLDGEIKGSVKQAFIIFCNENGIKTKNPYQSLETAKQRVKKERQKAALGL